MMIQTKCDDWKAKATIILVKTTSEMERMVTIISRSEQFKHGIIQIPWMLLDKLVKHIDEPKTAMSTTHRSNTDLYESETNHSKRLTNLT
jgi:hypothetical protein